MIKANWIKHTLQFKTPGGTSRGILHTKPSWIIKVYDTEKPTICGYGECSIIPNLSIDDIPEYEDKLQTILSQEINLAKIDQLVSYDLPSIKFGLETALMDLHNHGNKILFDSNFTKGIEGIPINGLIWMGDPDYMIAQIHTKIEQGFRCLKMKIGAIDFEMELSILKMIRNQFSKDVLELRVDANGAFCDKEAIDKLEKLSQYHLHSIEQPIKQNQWNEMAKLCANTPIPIALDEELIGICEKESMHRLLSIIKPQYIILKPGLLGGFSISDDWIASAAQHDIDWWITSALEGNIGLNAIAQWTYTKASPLHQGLGTGQLFTNNIQSPLEIINSKLYYNNHTNWDFSHLTL